MSPAAPIHLCFVCLGNICRSPTAEGVMAALVAEAGLADVIVVDSAGTAGWHRGEAPDPRATAEARRRGVELTSRASAFAPGDAAAYDLVLAMDRQNLSDLLDRTPEPELRPRLRLLREFDPALGRDDRWNGEVPDPWSGGEEGFAVVYDLIEAACRGLLDHLRRGPDGGTAQPSQPPRASS
ncbi:MAG TPA: low molecular weight protein-tyrosine-phosphatase [Acidimicrobiales bacterium]